MAISRVEIQGQVTRAQDFTTLKHNEDNKAVLDQSHFHNQLNRTVENRLHQVQQSAKPEDKEKRYDAKEKGNGSYEGDGGRKRKKEEKQKPGKIRPAGGSRFDIKI